MLKRKGLACGKAEADVAKLVAGPKVYICDECVSVASRIMKGEGPDQSNIQENRPSWLERLRARIHAFLTYQSVASQ